MENQIAHQEIDRLATEINVIKQQTAKTFLIASIEIGERLVQAKNLVPHGEWENWLQENVNYSQSTAQGFMKVYREYGGSQMNLSGKTPIEIFGNLTYTQALALIGLPPDEREKFVEDNNVEDMSTRELQKAVAEAKAAKEEAEAERRRAEEAERELREAEALEVARKTKTDELIFEAELAEKKYKSAEEKREKAEKAKAAADAEIAKLKAEIEEISKPRELTEEERAAIEEEIAKKYEAQINQMHLTAEAAEATAQQIQAEKEALEKKFQKESNADLQKFQALFERFQRDLGDLISLADKIGGENAERLKAALKSVVISSIGD